MQVMRIGAATAYLPEMHVNMVAILLQKYRLASGGVMTVVLSHYLPGGRAEWEAAKSPKVYIVLRGEITVTTASDEVVLYPYDSCLIYENERRLVENRTNNPASMLVVSCVQS